MSYDQPTDDLGASAPRRSKRRGARSALIAVATTALVVLAASTAVLAADRFADNIASVHRAGVGFVADAGITTGCGDGSAYCPNEPVTRDQMATFMHRLSGHAAGVDPSVDAETLQGLTPDDLAGLTSEDVKALIQDATPTVFWAVVTANGSLARSSDGVVSSAQLDPVGRYEIYFDRDVSACAYTATTGNPQTLGSISNGGAMFVGPRANEPTGIFTIATDADGNAQDRSFHVMVTC